MASNIVALNKEAHKNIKIKKNDHFLNAKDKNIALLQVHEFSLAATSYPIVFIKDSETGEFRSVAMLGLAPQENLFYSESGWGASYVPASIQGYPFLIAAESRTICVDVSSSLVNETEGDALFNEDGTESQYLHNVKESLAVFNSQSPVTSAFIKYIAAKNLLSPFSVTIRLGAGNDDAYELNGLYAIDNKVLQSLLDEDVLELKNKNYLFPIYAHLTSLNVISTLVQKKSRQ